MTTTGRFLTISGALKPVSKSQISRVPGFGWKVSIEERWQSPQLTIAGGSVRLLMIPVESTWSKEHGLTTKGLCQEVAEPLNGTPGQLVTNRGPATRQQEGSLTSPIDRERQQHTPWQQLASVRASPLDPSTDRVKIFGKYHE